MGIKHVTIGLNIEIQRRPISSWKKSRRLSLSITDYKREGYNKDNIRYLDSGASNHMCRIKEFFIYLKESV